MEVWVVDNASSDGSIDAVRGMFPEVNIIQNQKNLGFAAANNRAFAQMRGRYALLLNTDTVLMPGAVDEIYSFMEQHSDAGMACGQLLNPDGSRQNSFANFPCLASMIFNESLLRVLLPRKFPGKRPATSQPKEVESCIGACLMVRRAAMDAVGWLDESFFFFFEETDWAFRMQKAGWKVWWVPSARIVHFQGQSVGHHIQSRKLFYRSRYLYLKKWFADEYVICRWILFLRLLLNAALNFMGFLATLGMHGNIKNKMDVYAKLIAWHLKGCPDDR